MESTQHQFPVLNFQDFIREDGGKLTTDSLKVAAVFGKRHDDVLRRIRSLNCSTGFRLRNFAEVKETITYVAGGVEVSKETSRTSHYTMTKDGFTFLVMGFNGVKAGAWKEAYIEAFNAMEQFIKVQQHGLLARHFELQLEHKGKKRRASHAGRVLNEWKHDGPMLVAEMSAIDEKMNPQLALVVPKVA